MNSSTIIFLINDNVRAIRAIYEADTPAGQAAREVFKTLDPTIKVGDLVVVPTSTRHFMTVVKVVDVDWDIDLDLPAEVKWVVDKVDRSNHDRLQEQEQVAIQTVKSAEKRKKRDDLRAAVLLDSADQIKALPISAFDGEVITKK